MKIKDVITEGLYDYLTGLRQQKAQADWAKGSSDKDAYMSDYEKKSKAIDSELKAADAGPIDPNNAPLPKKYTRLVDVLKSRAARNNNTINIQEVGKFLSNMNLDSTTVRQLLPRIINSLVKQNINVVNPQRGSTAADQAKTNVAVPPEGNVFLVVGPGGQQYFKSYQGKWYMKYGAPDDYSITHQMTEPESVAALDRLLFQRSKKIPVRQDPTVLNRWVLDKAVATAKRQKQAQASI